MLIFSEFQTLGALALAFYKALSLALKILALALPWPLLTLEVIGLEHLGLGLGNQVLDTGASPVPTNWGGQYEAGFGKPSPPSVGGGVALPQKKYV